MPLAGILTPVIVTGGGLGDGSSFQPRENHIEANIVKVGVVGARVIWQHDTYADVESWAFARFCMVIVESAAIAAVGCGKLC